MLVYIMKKNSAYILHIKRKSLENVIYETLLIIVFLGGDQFKRKNILHQISKFSYSTSELLDDGPE